MNTKDVVRLLKLNGLQLSKQIRGDFSLQEKAGGRVFKYY